MGYRRRRAARANLIYVQPRPGDGAYGYGGGPQYPPQAHYDPSTGFAPVRLRRSLVFTPLITDAIDDLCHSPPVHHHSTTRHLRARPHSRQRSETNVMLVVVRRL